MWKCHIEKGLVQIIEVLYKRSKGAVLVNNQLEYFNSDNNWWRLSMSCPLLLNNFMENIMRETLTSLHNHHTFVSIVGRPTRNFCFADYTDLVAGSSRELQVLTDWHTSPVHTGWRLAMTRVKSWSTSKARQSRDLPTWMEYSSRS